MSPTNPPKDAANDARDETEKPLESAPLKSSATGDTEKEQEDPHELAVGGGAPSEHAEQQGKVPRGEGERGERASTVAKPWDRKRGLAVIAAGGVLLVLYARFVFPSLAVERSFYRLGGMDILPIPRLGEIGQAIAKGILALLVLSLLGLEALREWADKRKTEKKELRGSGGLPGMLGRVVTTVAPFGSKRIVKRALFVFAVLGAFAYFNFGDLGYNNFYHRWDIYHYYVGSKYSRELGYTKLYACAAVAQSEISPREAGLVRKRRWRDLSSNTIEPGDTALLQAAECHGRFSPDKWNEFRSDVAFFKSVSDQKYWDDMQIDHGYNPPPLWTMIGGTVAKLTPATEPGMKNLACLDLLLFTATFAALYWGFGGRLTAIALIFWGTQFPANMFFTGGAFLRQDWLFFLVLSMALARRRKPGWAGVSLAVSGLLRVFPMLFVFGWVVALGGYFYERRAWNKPMLHALAGVLAAVLVLVPVSAVVAGPTSYQQFVSHLRVHNDTPLTNHMGLKTLCSFSYNGRMKRTRDNKLRDPFERWKELRRETFHSRRWAFGVAALGSLAAIFIAGRRRKSVWVVGALGVLAVTALTELTCYYYSFFLAAVPLAKVDRSYEKGFIAAGAVSSLLLPLRLSYFWDDRYEAQALVFFAFATLLAIGLFPQPVKPRGAPAAVAVPVAAEGVLPAPEPSA